MDARALVLFAALVLGACGDSDTDPIGPFPRPSAGGGASHDTTTSSTKSCCGVLEVVTDASGAAPYWAPSVHVWDATVWDDWVAASLPASGTARASLMASTYWVGLYLPPNCSGEIDGTGSAYREVQISAGDTVRVSATIDCDPAGSVGVNVALSEGEIGSSSITLRLRRQDAPGIWEVRWPSHRSQPYMLLAGDWTVETEVPDHCETTEAGPTAFSLAEGGVVDIAIRLRCEWLTGMLHVTTSTSGRDAKLVLHTGGECEYQFDDETWTSYSTNCIDLPPNGARTFYFPRGTRTVRVTHDATCSVAPPDPVGVEIVGGETTELAVTATCD